MRAYTGFAYVYDKFMDNVPYDEWTAYLERLLKEYGVNDGIILELGCGTGNITRRLADLGYDMIGIDNSEDMLDIAREKEMDAGLLIEDEVDGNEIPKILYLNQDMREFELYGTVAAVVCICDGMNYITKEEELLSVFKLVNNYLDANGLFVFDLNTIFKYRNILGDTTIAENRDDCSFIWENYFHENEMINEYEVTIYKKAEFDEDEEELYERFQETHYQKAYELETIIRLLEEAGMEYVTAYDAFTKNPPKQDSERIYVIAREKKQENKLYLNK